MIEYESKIKCKRYKIDILTLKANRKKIDEILVKKTNIIEIEEYLEKVKIKCVVSAK